MLVVFDLETTGTDPKSDRIIQIAALKVNEEFVEKERLVKLIDPAVHIPTSAAKIHGFTDTKVKGLPKFSNIASEVAEFFQDCDLGGYNVLSFDIPLLQAELLRCSIPFDIEGRKIYDAMRIFQHYEDYTLESAYRLYCHDELEGAHDALEDTSATLAVLEAQRDLYRKHKNQPVEELSDLYKNSTASTIDQGGMFVWNGEDQACINFGKHKGKTLEHLVSHQSKYLQWLQRQSIADEAAVILKQAFKGKLPERK